MSCQSCIYSAVSLDPQSKQSGKLLCRAQPPVPHAIALQQREGVQVQILTLWPVVERSDICGAYERNDEIKPS